MVEHWSNAAGRMEYCMMEYLTMDTLIWYVAESDVEMCNIPS